MTLTSSAIVAAGVHARDIPHGQEADRGKVLQEGAVVRGGVFDGQPLVARLSVATHRALAVLRGAAGALERERC